MDSKTAKKIKNKNTKIERLLAKAMWNVRITKETKCFKIKIWLDGWLGCWGKSFINAINNYIEIIDKL